MNTVGFTRSLVKGRIAETIFSQMFRDAGIFTVLEFGYEKIMPELLQGNYNHDNPVIETLRVAPDFAIINQETKEVRLIEVKYRRAMDLLDIKRSAEKMHDAWNPSYLFLATLDGFYFDEVSKIIDNNGNISKFKHTQIPDSLQREYLQILRDFETDN